MHVCVCVFSGVLEMGEVNSAALMEFQGHITRFQVYTLFNFYFLSVVKP